MMATSAEPMFMSGGSDNGWGGSGALIAILALAFCGGGFGNRGGHDEAVDNAELNQRIDALGSREDLARNLEATCMTQRDILEAKYDIGNQIAQNRFDDAIGFKDVELQLAQCCCNTQAAITESKQEILDKLNVNEVKALENQIAELRRQIAVPAYATYPACTPVFPPTPAVGVGGFGYGCNGGF